MGEDIYTYEQWQHEVVDHEMNPCMHSVFGSCTHPCPWCGVRGFYGPREDNDRKYRMCKWCMRIQNVGGAVQQCVYEVCQVCRPGFDGTYPPNTEPVISFSETSRITLSPGHPCKKCGSKMEVIELKGNPMEPFKKEVDEIHLY